MNVFRSLSGRTLLLSLFAGALLASIAATASAKTLVEIGGVATPPITAFTTTPQNLFLTVETKFSSDVPGELPGTIKKATVFFSHGPRVNSKLFPSCDPAKLLRLHGDPRGCPRGSRLGTGMALGTAESFESVIERVTVDVYNGPGGRSVLFFLHGLHPVAITGLIVAPLQKINTRRWGYKLTLPVPPNLQQIANGIFASLLNFKVKVGGTVQVREGGRMVRRGYIEALACPPGALVPTRGEFDLLGGERVASDGYIACGGR